MRRSQLLRAVSIILISIFYFHPLKIHNAQCDTQDTMRYDQQIEEYRNDQVLSLNYQSNIHFDLLVLRLTSIVSDVAVLILIFRMSF